MRAILAAAIFCAAAIAPANAQYGAQGYRADWAPCDGDNDCMIPLPGAHYPTGYEGLLPSPQQPGAQPNKGYDISRDPGKWMASLRQPNRPQQSCCGPADAYGVEIVQDGGDNNIWRVKVTDDAIIVNPDNTLRPPLPKGTEFQSLPGHVDKGRQAIPPRPRGSSSPSRRSTTPSPSTASSRCRRASERSARARVSTMADLLTELLGFPRLMPIAAAPAGVAKPAPAPSPDAPTPGAAIPQDCLTFVEDEEDGSATYYAAHYTHFEWPAGASGPTIAVGYDCGYVTADEARADWTGIVGDATVAAIVRAMGLRGSAAQAFVSANRDSVTISWDQAAAEFSDREVPKWLARCRAALPNFDLLPGECQGSLFSLTYNRGQGGYTVSAADDPSGRYTEMRAIRAAMIAKDFAAIPADITSMQRLWPRGGDLWRRRAHEAALFQKGLAAT